jgi:asparagine synthase (glutamine-hydrolysing)
MESIGTWKNGNITLGCLWHKGAEEEFAHKHDSIVVMNGAFYRARAEIDAERVLRRVNSLSVRGAIREASQEVGGFAGLVAQKDGLFAFRDVNGLKPLYFSNSSHLTAFSSERKALWRIGLKNPQAIVPGSLVALTRKGLTSRQLVRFSHPRERKITFQQASTTVRRLLSTSIRRITYRTSKVCVAFSGGLDSALTAAMAKKAGVDVEAVSVGLADSPEILTVEKFADELGLHVTVETFPLDCIEEYVRRVLWLIEEPNMMKLSVAIPLHWAAMVAARCRYEFMLCGQGSDELYGGYNKYTHTLGLRGRRALSDQLYESVIESSSVNYERDDKATSPFPVELRTPFADPDLIKFSLTIPSEFKVKDGNDVTRKWVLRDVAREVGVPPDIVWRRKKAIQHGTGVEKAILKLARKRGLRPEEYLSTTFREVSGLESIP